MRFVFHNDTGRIVKIHPATESHGIKCDMGDIKPLEARFFYLPDKTYPFIKMWDYGEEIGLSILVSPQKDDE